MYLVSRVVETVKQTQRLFDDFLQKRLFDDFGLITTVQRVRQPAETFLQSMVEEQKVVTLRALKALDEAFEAKIASGEFAVRSEPSPEVELVSKALRIAGSPERLSEWLQTAIPALNARHHIP